MTLKTFGVVGSVLVLFGGCPNRQTTPRIVYVPAPPAAAGETSQKSTQVMVIQEPAPATPPAPDATQPAAPAEEEHARTSRPAHRAEPPPAPEHPEEAAPMPALQPSESPAQAAALRREVTGLQSQVRQQIDQLSHSGLSGADVRALDSARAFLAQSIHALQDSDLQRALNLARKARLLVAAIDGSE